jgi:hypothetical protein
VLSLPLLRRNASTLALAVAGACLAPETLHAALASAGGLVLEAAPLAIAAASLGAGMRALGRRGARALPGAVADWLAALAGCGCGGLPGALSLPAAGLTWYAFGPLLAIGRFGAAAVLGRFRHSHHEGQPGGPLDQLGALVPYAIAGSIGAEWLRRLEPQFAGWPAAGIVAGAVVGALSPCTLGTIALAASVRRGAPWVAAGILLTAGLATVRGAPPRAPFRADPSAGYALLAAAGAALAAWGGAGLVHPRLVWPVVAAGMLGLALSVRSRLRGASLLGPVVAWVALLLGSPVPQSGLDETLIAGAFPGQAVHFTGKAECRADACLLVRFAITCCRADASPVAVRLAGSPPLRSGAWATVDGVLEPGPHGLIVRVERLSVVAAPRDAFIYR